MSYRGFKRREVALFGKKHQQPLNPKISICQHAHQQAVKVGIRQDDKVQIVEGLKEGQRIVTDGAYATYTTMVPYIQRWIKIYSDNHRLQRVLPTWFYGLIGVTGMNRVARNRGVTYPSVEKAVGKLRRPVLMIQGESDTYIKPEMALALYERAAAPKDLWLVPGAKHNQAIAVAEDEYHRRVVEFFDRHLAGVVPDDDSAPHAVVTM